MSDKKFRRWEPDQQILFPPSIRDFVPQGHLAHFVRDVVRDDLDLSAIFARYTERRGQPPYHPALMTSLLLYAYSRGIYSSRRIERACQERVDFMALTGGEKPDHSTICLFRSDHREALSALFVQVLALCRDAGMVKLGHVALDGYEQAYNCQAGVEAGSQVIVCHGVRAEQNDHDELVPMVDQIKEARGFRQFLRRGLNNVAGEWALICTVHNLLKLAGISTVPAS